jgi:hypothetical protein
VVVDVGGEDEFIGVGDVDEILQAAGYGFGGANGGNGEGLAGVGFFGGRPEGVDVVDGRRNLAGRAATKIGEGLLERSEVVASFGVGGRDDDVDAKHGVGARELFGGLEELAIQAKRIEHIGRREVRSEGEWQAEMRGELRAIQAGAEQPDGNVQPGAGIGADFFAGIGHVEIVLEFEDVFGKALGGGGEIAAKRTSGEWIGARSAAESEIDAAGEKRGERAELFNNDQRRMIGKHDAAGADADCFCAAGDVRDDDGSGGAGDAGHVVVLGEPEAVVAPGFGVLREIERVAEGVGGGGALWDGGEVQDGERDHFCLSSDLMRLRWVGLFGGDGASDARWMRDGRDGGGLGNGGRRKRNWCGSFDLSDMGRSSAAPLRGGTQELLRFAHYGWMANGRYGFCFGLVFPFRWGAGAFGACFF